MMVKTPIRALYGYLYTKLSDELHDLKLQCVNDKHNWYFDSHDSIQQWSFFDEDIFKDIEKGRTLSPYAEIKISCYDDEQLIRISIRGINRFFVDVMDIKLETDPVRTITISKPNIQETGLYQGGSIFTQEVVENIIYNMESYACEYNFGTDEEEKKMGKRVEIKHSGEPDYRFRQNGYFKIGRSYDFIIKHYGNLHSQLLNKFGIEPCNLESNENFVCFSAICTAFSDCRREAVFHCFNMGSMLMRDFRITGKLLADAAMVNSDDYNYLVIIETSVANGVPAEDCFGSKHGHVPAFLYNNVIENVNRDLFDRNTFKMHRQYILKSKQFLPFLPQYASEYISTKGFKVESCGFIGNNGTAVFAFEYEKDSNHRYSIPARIYLTKGMITDYDIWFEEVDEDGCSEKEETS